MKPHYGSPKLRSCTISQKTKPNSLTWKIMPINFATVKYFPRVFKNALSNNGARKLPTVNLLPRMILGYSTAMPKQLFNVLDLVTDVLSVSQTYNLECSQPINPIKSVQQKRKDEMHKVDELVSNLDISNAQTTVKILINELHTNIESEDWDCVNKILQFFVNKKAILNKEIILNFAQKFSDAGFTSGLESLLSLSEVSEDGHSVRNEIRHCLVKCNWRIGNVDECLSTLRDSYEEPSNEISSRKQLLRIIIYQSVTNHSEAVLINVTNFVQDCTEKYQDHYPIIILWNDLFMSDWFSNHQLADTLLSKYENLRTSVAMFASTLAQNFIQRGKCKDVYRLLEVLLKYEMKQPYASVTRMLYDYYSQKGDKSRCSEIIRSSIILKIPLREQQYNSFISWSVSGNPYKYIKPEQLYIKKK